MLMANLVMAQEFKLNDAEQKQLAELPWENGTSLPARDMFYIFLRDREKLQGLVANLPSAVDPALVKDARDALTQLRQLRNVKKGHNAGYGVTWRKFTRLLDDIENIMRRLDALVLAALPTTAEDSWASLQGDVRRGVEGTCRDEGAGHFICTCTMGWTDSRMSARAKPAPEKCSI